MMSKTFIGDNHVFLLMVLLTSMTAFTTAFTIPILPTSVPHTPLHSPSHPILISNVLTPSEANSLASSFYDIYSNAILPMQTKIDQTVYHEDVPLSTFLNTVNTSTHTSPIFCFAEGLLSDSPLSSDLTSIRDSVFSPFDPDWFQSFPSSIRPTDCVVLSGAGSTSTLHRDPFEWTGTSLCLSGKKTWRFIKSTPAIESTLSMKRVPSIAWCEIDLSAGWESPNTLFSIVDSFVPAGLTPEPKTSDDLRPDIPLPEGTEVYEVTQNEGDFIIIPKNWIHQTYSTVSSLAVASQRCGLGDVKSVMEHMGERAGVEVELPEEFEADDMEGILGRVLEKVGVEYDEDELDG
ncbi:hypothetical protein TrVE_jg12990 [Triparma verrucosa]|uniref:JmjC domain-containing protein n=1 Tax=Triparma verrucosa TaxID=1606542 RepID=A0A9W7EM40_9STRA|nr:hypothetical protein TrVE_jg12990 [Triparma verrucosa]